eukprot:PhF_6_TR3737/c1_g1_i5/m.5376
MMPSCFHHSNNPKGRITANSDIHRIDDDGNFRFIKGSGAGETARNFPDVNPMFDTHHDTVSKLFRAIRLDNTQSLHVVPLSNSRTATTSTPEHTISLCSAAKVTHATSMKAVSAIG